MKQVAYVVRFVLEWPEDRERPWPEQLINQLETRMGMPQKIGESRVYAITGVDYISEGALPGLPWSPTKPC